MTGQMKLGIIVGVVSALSLGPLMAGPHRTRTQVATAEASSQPSQLLPGETLANAQLWNSKSQSQKSLPNGLVIARQGHQATLLPDGQVLLLGGIGTDGRALENGELYDPEAESFSLINTPPSTQNGIEEGPQVAASLPEDGSGNVPADVLVGIRFSEPLDVRTVSGLTIKLSGPNGEIAIKVVPAESGLLAFVSPNQELEAATRYTINLDGLADPLKRTLSESQISFTTSNGGLWVPTSNDWKTGLAASRWQLLEPLTAPPGVTAIAGQVLKLDGDPLPDVTLQTDSGHKARTDGTGRFLLSGVTAGHSVILIDGRTASRPKAAYGVFEYGTDVTAGVTNVLPFTIWMPLLDMGHAVTIPSPTVTETVVSTPLIPGLELHIPANTVIYDSDGKVMTQISITPVPLDRPPFPLPRGVDVPLYFTIQPGAAYIKVLTDSGPKGARLFYPNNRNSHLGTRFNFWDYDPDQKGWYVYGHGGVSQDGEQIIPDPGVVIYEFTGAMVIGSSVAPSSGACPGGPSDPACRHAGEPVDLGTGLFVLTKTDLMLPDVLPIVLTRYYRPGDSISRAFGIGASQSYDLFLVGDKNPYTYQDLVLADGSRVHYPRISPHTNLNQDWPDAVYECTSSLSAYYGSLITWNGNGWKLKMKNGTLYTFPDSADATTSEASAAISITDRYGNTLALTRDSSHNLTQITSPNGRYVQLTYDSSNRITQAQDDTGRKVTYVYDATGRLSTVTDANLGVTTHTYD